MAWHNVITEATEAASTKIHKALVDKGYRVLAQHAARTNRQMVFTVYGNGQHTLVMHTLSEGDRQVMCELYRPVAESNSIDDTIAAIP